MKDVMEYGKRLLIATVGALAILTVVVVLLEWKNISEGLYVCSICKDEFWLFPKKVTILEQSFYVCRPCAKMIQELGQQITSLFG